MHLSSLRFSKFGWFYTSPSGRGLFPIKNFASYALFVYFVELCVFNLTKENFRNINLSLYYSCSCTWFVNLMRFSFSGNNITLSFLVYFSNYFDNIVIVQSAFFSIIKLGSLISFIRVSLLWPMRSETYFAVSIKYLIKLISIKSNL